MGLTCYSYNLGARELYERLGFVFEGRLRESVWYDGAWYDEIILGMLKSEWDTREKEKTGKVNGITNSMKNL